MKPEKNTRNVMQWCVSKRTINTEKATEPYELRFAESTTSLVGSWINNISIYPNLAVDVLNIKHNLDKIDKHLSGRAMMVETDFSESSLNISELMTGMYLLRLTSNDDVVSLKF